MHPSNINQPDTVVRVKHVVQFMLLWLAPERNIIIAKSQINNYVIKCHSIMYIDCMQLECVQTCSIFW